MIAALFLAAALFSLARAGPEIPLTAAERSEIVRGRTVLREIPDLGRPGRTFEALGRLRGSLDEAFVVITDFRRYAEFMPNVRRASVRGESPGVSVVELEIGLPFGQSRRYRLRYESRREEGGFTVSWRKVAWPGLPADQTVRDTEGRWLVRPFEGGGLLASYLVYADPRPVPFGLSGIANAFGKRSLPDVIRNVERRILALFPREGGERPGPQNSRP